MYRIVKSALGSTGAAAQWMAGTGLATKPARPSWPSTAQHQSQKASEAARRPAGQTLLGKPSLGCGRGAQVEAGILGKARKTYANPSNIKKT